MSTVVGSSQNGGAIRSTQMNGGAPHLSSVRAPSLPQIIHDDPEFDQIHVQDWDEQAGESEPAVGEEELIRIQ
jgi:hypothetical protein